MSGFEEWWALVWRKERKLAAMREFRIALDLEIVDYLTLCQAARRRTAAYLSSRTPTDKQCMPATWLAERRWTDELPAVPESSEAAERHRLRMKMDLHLRRVLHSRPDTRDVARALELSAITEEQARQLGL